MHGAKLTGYNKMGLLVPMLTNAEIIAKEQKAHARDTWFDQLPTLPFSSVWADSQLRRWVRLFTCSSHRARGGL